jgi:hypothetical protein
MTMRILKLASPLAAALVFLSGCGAKEFRADQAPLRPFGQFGKVEGMELQIEVPDFDKMEPGDQQYVRVLAKSFPDMLRSRLAEKKLFAAEAADTLVIQGRITQFDPGSQAARWMIGLGAGSGEIVAEIRFDDARGVSVAKGSAVGGVTGGLAGGSLDSAVKRLVDAVVRFIQENYDEVRAPGTAAPVRPRK